MGHYYLFFSRNNIFCLIPTLICMFAHSSLLYSTCLLLKTSYFIVYNLMVLYNPFLIQKPQNLFGTPFRYVLRPIDHSYHLHQIFFWYWSGFYHFHFFFFFLNLSRINWKRFRCTLGLGL